MIRIARFLPALLLLVFWLGVVHQGNALKQAQSAPITSARFINTIARGIDDPWTHISALRILFRQMGQKGAAAGVWAGSQPYGWALWHEYQYAGSIEIMMTIAHASGNLLEERRWAELYAASEPNNPLVQRLLARTRSAAADKGPLEITGKW